MLNFYNSHRWTKCPASPNPSASLARIFGEVSVRTDSQLEGDAAAWVAAAVLDGNATSTQDYLGEDAPNGWTVTEDMVVHVQRYIDITRLNGREITAEHDVTIFEGLVSGRPDCHTADGGEILRVLEMKYGWTIVEPEKNTQLLLGAIAFVKPQHQLISLEIFQPRPHHPAGPHRKWTITPAELHQWATWLYERALATTEPVPAAIPGDHCTHCPHTHCHARSKAIYGIAEAVGDTRRDAPLSAVQLGAELSFLRSALALIASKEANAAAEAEARARKGEFIPGWMLEPTNGKRVVTAKPEAVAMLTGVDPFKQVLKSPAELERDGVHPDTVKLISNTPRIGFKLVEHKDKIIDRLFRASKR